MTLKVGHYFLLYYMCIIYIYRKLLALYILLTIYIFYVRVQKLQFTKVEIKLHEIG